MMNDFPKSEVIMHYASPYYDPVKAHEYYEEHKQLKGRHSTAGLNEKGREAAQYIRKRLSEEKKDKTDMSRLKMRGWISASRTHANTTKKKNRDSYKVSVETYKERTKSAIDDLRESLKGLSASDRKGPAGESIRNRISSLREANSAHRKRLQEVLKAANESASNEHKLGSEHARNTHKENAERYKQEYETKYEKELDALKSDASMVSNKKRK